MLEELTITETNPSRWLRVWVDKLLNYKDAPGAWQFMCRDYFDRSCKIVGLDEQNPNEVDRVDTMLSSGKAISSLGAAQCTWQGSRTAKFIQGVHQAILDLQQRFPSETLRVLYAGCGPLAPLVLPLLAHFGCENISFDLLDIHESSLARAKTLAAHFGVEQGIHEWICGDAAAFTPPDGHPGYHMIISEVMQQALQNEPQVAVTINLAQFLVEGGVFIPDRIQLSLQYYNSGARLNATLNGGGDIEQFTQPIADLFELTPELAKGWGGYSNRIPAAKVEIPPPNDPKASLYVFTDIQVYDSTWLGAYECSLNLPVEMSKVLTGKTEAEFFYEINEKPGLRVLK